MANDPFSSTDEKKRRSLRYSAAATALAYPGLVVPEKGVVGAAGDIAGGIGQAARDVGGAASQLGTEIAYGRQGLRREAQAAATPQPSTDFSQVNGGADTINSTAAIQADPAKFGLTRIVKTKDANGNSVYTNVAGPTPAGAEVRYYNQYGNREGAIDPTNPTSGYVQNLDADPRRLSVAADNGRKSLAYAARGQAEYNQNVTDAAMATLDPSDRVRLMIAQQSEAGNERRSLRDYGLNVAKFGLDQQKTEAQAANDLAKLNQADRAAAIKDPQGTMQRFIAENANLSQKDLVAKLSDPNDPNAAAARFAFNSLIKSTNTNLDQSTSIAALKKNPAWITALGGSPYRDASNVFDGFIGNTGVKAPAGFDNDLIQAFIDADIRNRSQN